MIINNHFHQKQSNPNAFSRRNFLKLGLYGVTGLAAEALASACSSVLPHPTATPIPTDTPTPTPVPTDNPTPTSTGTNPSNPTPPPNTHTIKTKDGRMLSYIEAAQLEGIPVLVFSGTPMSRILAPSWINDAKARGIRLICYDRPGYGGSTSYPGRTVASAAEDTSELAKALGLKKLLVWGISGGGPHAIACAALLPELVVAAAALASVAPYVPFTAEGNDWYVGMSSDNVSEYQAALRGRDELKSFVEGARGYFLSVSHDDFCANNGCLRNPTSAKIVSREISDFLLDSVCLGLQNGTDGWVDDDLAFLSKWGFEPDQVQIPFFLMQGESDNTVPVSNGKWLAKKIPNVENRFIPDEDHLAMMTHVPEIHQWLLSKWK